MLSKQKEGVMAMVRGFTARQHTDRETFEERTARVRKARRFLEREATRLEDVRKNLVRLTDVAMMSEPSEDRFRLVDTLDGYAGEIDEELGRLDDLERDLLADAPADPYEYLED